jgi:hypothetical protein
MNYFIAGVLLAVSMTVTAQLVRIYAHNDYQKAGPLVNVIRNNVYSMESFF